ncbi:carbonic anhydrase [Streptomyces zagrosensis]|uniref:Carbonic anhydrase n=1 Tax=Streptomyces zagrosensis TaxID=1042984 RepID=A0A7W9Q6S1_9ACTN|nr:carbonic anhydrase [Streptomyces zagrosensis]MBB5934646.1 carbonic anhydrase [Streptomyces zagrosensis]
MKSLIDHARTFQDQLKQRGEHLAPLAAGQSPEALFITCSDSRVIPSLITGARPGGLFELRTAGNIVPEYRPERPSGETATIEYAVEVLRVADIIVCGHSHCGAVGALVRGDDLAAVPAVSGWLAHAAASPTGPDGPLEPGDHGPEVARPVQAHVRAQLERLRGYPCVTRRMAAGELTLHGWFYEVHTGAVLAHQPAIDDFLPL